VACIKPAAGNNARSGCPALSSTIPDRRSYWTSANDKFIFTFRSRFKKVQIVGFKDLLRLIVDHRRYHIILGPFNQSHPLFFSPDRFSIRKSAFQLGAKVFVINANKS
jgi:hypothetical protein